MTTATKPAAASLDAPEQHLTRGGVEIDVVHLGDMKVKRATYPRGWRFSKDMGEDRCGDTHVGYCLSGGFHIVLGDGTELDIKTGDAFAIPANHDAWTVGDEPATIVQFDEGGSAAERYGL